MQSPCGPEPCPDRRPHCHGACEKYKKFQIYRESESVARTRAVEATEIMINGVRNVTKEWKRKK